MYKEKHIFIFMGTLITKSNQRLILLKLLRPVSWLYIVAGLFPNPITKSFAPRSRGILFQRLRVRTRWQV